MVIIVIHISVAKYMPIPDVRILTFKIFDKKISFVVGNSHETAPGSDAGLQ